MDADNWIRAENLGLRRQFYHKMHHQDERKRFFLFTKCFLSIVQHMILLNNKHGSCNNINSDKDTRNKKALHTVYKVGITHLSTVLV